MKLINFFATFIFTILLSSCGTISKPIGRIIPKNQLQKINKFYISGRIGIITNNHNDSGDFLWQQNDTNNYKLIIYGPLHQESIQIIVSPKKAILINEKNQQINAKTAQELIQNYTSWYIPTQSLQKWILGIPNTNTPITEATYETEGVLIYLNQDNWKIDYLQYSNFNGNTMPKKLNLNNDYAKIKLVINKWVINY